MRKLLRFMHGHVTQFTTLLCAYVCWYTAPALVCLPTLALANNRCLGILHRSLPEFVSQTLVEFLQTLDNRSQTLVVYLQAFVLFLQKFVMFFLRTLALPSARRRLFNYEGECGRHNTLARGCLLALMTRPSFLPETPWADSSTPARRVLLTSAAPAGLLSVISGPHPGR